MKNLARTITLAVGAALILAACGSAADDTEPPAPEATAAEEDVQAEGNADDDIVIEGEDSGIDGPGPESYPLEGTTGTNSTGTTYTIGPAEALPDDIVDMLSVADIDGAELYALPVTIDNSGGSEAADIYSLTIVTEGGEQHEYTTMAGYLQDTSDEAELSDTDYGTYEAMWDRAEDFHITVAPTATDTDYYVLDIDPSAADVTYAEVQPSAWGEPVSLIPAD